MLGSVDKAADCTPGSCGGHVGGCWMWRREVLSRKLSKGVYKLRRTENRTPGRNPGVGKAATRDVG